jgi:hypothetical protein
MQEDLHDYENVEFLMSVTTLLDELDLRGKGITTVPALLFAVAEAVKELKAKEKGAQHMWMNEAGKQMRARHQAELTLRRFYRWAYALEDVMIPAGLEDDTIKLVGKVTNGE